MQNYFGNLLDERYKQNLEKLKKKEEEINLKYFRLKRYYNPTIIYNSLETYIPDTYEMIDYTLDEDRFKKINTKYFEGKEKYDYDIDYTNLYFYLKHFKGKEEYDYKKDYSNLYSYNFIKINEEYNPDINYRNLHFYIIGKDKEQYNPNVNYKIKNFIDKNINLEYFFYNIYG